MMILGVKQFTRFRRFGPECPSDFVCHEGKQMAPKPTRFFAVGMALTILAVMTCATAAPSESILPIYQPQLLLLY
jgi:hypothetical protein